MFTIDHCLGKLGGEMDQLEKICLEMAQNPHIMTFSDIGKALAKGVAVGHKSGVPGGVVIGAALSLSIEASMRVDLMLQDTLRGGPVPRS
jgi:hypothetical protein